MKEHNKEDKSLVMTEAPSGQMLYGDKTDKEKKNENKEYQDNMLNE